MQTKNTLLLPSTAGCGSSVVARRLAVWKATGSFPDPTKRASCVLFITKAAVIAVVGHTLLQHLPRPTKHVILPG